MFRKAIIPVVCGVFLALAGSLSAADYALVRDGKAVSAIVVQKNADLPVNFGARELSLYLGKISKASPKIANAPVGGVYNVYVGTLKDAELVKKAGIDPKSLKEDGFALIAKKDGLYIIGQNPRGALYGCYEILKKYGGVRWLFPGDDGEYFTAKKTVAVPEQKTVRNPYLSSRIIQCGQEIGGEINGATWLARNNAFSAFNPSRKLKNGVLTPKGIEFAERGMKSCVTAQNSHILTNMLGGWNGKKMKANIHKLYQEHPEYFPMIKGKRVEIYGAGDPNPCITSPGLLDHMANNLYEHIKGPYGSQGVVTIGNNDTTVWCQCENCKKLDTASLAHTKGARADRYWYMVNEIAKRIWKKDPSVRLGGWAYQDFWYPPVKVKIDPRLSVKISFNNQCWRHTIRDPKCSVNRELCKIMEAWKKTGLKNITNRDEISAGSVGENYLPSEKVLYLNFKDYPALGFSGSNFCTSSPFPVFQYWSKNRSPFYGKNLRFAAMWQTCYLSTQFMWDINQDFDKLYEEANSLFYGKAWEGGFKEFRKYQTKYFTETPGCFGWGQGAPLGRCLDQAGSEAKLCALMDQAVAAAKQDKDPRVLQHILRDKEIFEKTWLKQRKIYLENFKELNVYKRTAPIKIDGVLDEADWKNADTLSNFKPGGHTPATRIVEQSFVRVVYDTDYLYIAVEAMEPFPDKIIAGSKVSGWNELGNCLELFYNYPDMADKYYHLAINSKGQIIDAIQLATTKRNNDWNTKAQYAVKVLKDRWILEIAIPCSEIGMNCYDGSTWKLNVGRNRQVEGMKANYGKLSAKSETSSCCNGIFHGAANYINIKFTPKRASGLVQGHDTAAWKNAGFNNVVPDSSINKHYRYNRGGKWKFEDAKQLVPKVWTVSGKAAGICRKEGENYYIELTEGYISQYFVGEGKGELQVIFRARGKGTFALWTCSYQNRPKGENGYKQLPKTSKNTNCKLTDKWQSFKVSTVKLGVPTERVAVRFSVHKDSILDLDDVYVTLIKK